MKYIEDLIERADKIVCDLERLNGIVVNTPSINERLFLDLFDKAVKAATESGKLKADSNWLMDRGETEEELALGIKLNNDSVEKWREWNGCRITIEKLFGIME